MIHPLTRKWQSGMRIYVYHCATCGYNFTTKREHDREAAAAARRLRQTDKRYLKQGSR